MAPFETSRRGQTGHNREYFQGTHEYNVSVDFANATIYYSRNCCENRLRSTV